MANDMERLKKIIEAKKAGNDVMRPDKKIGSGRVEKSNKSEGNWEERTKKISQ